MSDWIWEHKVRLTIFISSYRLLAALASPDVSSLAFPFFPVGSLPFSLTLMLSVSLTYSLLIFELYHFSQSCHSYGYIWLLRWRQDSSRGELLYDKLFHRVILKSVLQLNFTECRRAQNIIYCQIPNHLCIEVRQYWVTCVKAHNAINAAYLFM